ncbi:MAG: hypothetical protein JW956_13415 [Calditrichaceae bacterium]|nr:hypothetical protein [Calditrichaceae bacterium]
MLKNITLSADENLISKAREKARREKTTLNANFRQWLRQYIGKNTKASSYINLMQQLDYVNAGSKFRRDQLNER